MVRVRAEQENGSIGIGYQNGFPSQFLPHLILLKTE